MRQKSRFDSPSASDVITLTAIEALQQSSRQVPILADAVDVALAVRDKAQRAKTSSQKALILSHRLIKTLETLADATQPDPRTLPPLLRENISSFKEFLTEIDNAMSSLTSWKARLKLGSKRKEYVLDTFIRRLDQVSQDFMSHSSQADEQSLGVQREGALSPTQCIEVGLQYHSSPPILSSHVEPIPDETLTQNGSSMFEQSRKTHINGSTFYSVGHDAHIEIIQSGNIPNVEEKLSQIKHDVSYGNAMLSPLLKYTVDPDTVAMQV